MASFDRWKRSVFERRQGLQDLVGLDVTEASRRHSPQRLAQAPTRLDHLQRKGKNKVNIHKYKYFLFRGSVESTFSIYSTKLYYSVTLTVESLTTTSWNPASTCPPVRYSICLPACTSRQPSGMATRHFLPSLVHTYKPGNLDLP